MQTQQEQWNRLKTAKVRAWHQFQNNRNKKSITWLMDYTYAKHPEKFKVLRQVSNKLMTEAKAGRKYEPVGVDADNKDAWFCLNATIVRPDMVAVAMFTKHMRPDEITLLTLFPADKKSVDLDDWNTFRFGFGVSPSVFYKKELSQIIEAGGELTVRRKGDLVELDYTDPNNPRKTPREIHRFDLSKGGVCVASWNRGRHSVVEHEKIEGVWVPQFIKEHNLIRYEETNFFGWTLNAPSKAKDFSPKSFPVDPEQAVVDKRTTPRTQFRLSELED